MKLSVITLMLAATVGLILPGCKYSDKGEEGKITTDLINNSNSASADFDPEHAPELAFEVSKYDFGTITQGELVEYTYKLKNTGNGPLIISQVSPSCGCTDLKTWPDQPIAPGGTGEIAIQFDSEGRKGKVRKSISVVANTSPSTTILYLNGEILVPDNMQ